MKHRKKLKRFSPSFIISCSGAILAELILIVGGNVDMETVGWISLTVAIIGAAGGIWAQVVQFKKDAQRIEGVGKTTNDVKTDTLKMIPAVNKIESNTDTIKDRMLEDILPGIKTINKLEGGLDILVKNAEYEKRLRKDVTNAVTDPAIIKSAVDVIYEENAKLNKRVAELYNRNIILQNENSRLHKENKFLKNMVQDRNYDIQEEELPSYEMEDNDLEI